MKRLIVFLLAVLSTAIASAYVLQRATVHDPSIVWNPATQTYYVFGSHRAAAKTTDLMAWTQFTAPWQTATSTNAANNAAFTTQEVTKVTIGGVERDFKNFNAHDWSAAISSYGSTSWGSIDGNMWAPDVISTRQWESGACISVSMVCASTPVSSCSPPTISRDPIVIRHQWLSLDLM